MSTLPLVDPDTATGATADLLAAVRRSFGVTPNLTKAMANSPALLKGYLKLSGALSADDITAARTSTASNPKTAALLGFATAVNSSRGAITPDHIVAVRAAGASDEEIAETIGHVALNVLTNYFNKAAGVDIDFPVVTV